MKPNHFAALSDAIDKCMEKICAEDGQISEQYIYTNLHVDMARAAEIVFDAAEKGQDFYEAQQ